LKLQLEKNMKHFFSLSTIFLVLLAALQVEAQQRTIRIEWGLITPAEGIEITGFNFYLGDSEQAIKTLYDPDATETTIVLDVVEGDSVSISMTTLTASGFESRRSEPFTVVFATPPTPTAELQFTADGGTVAFDATGSVAAVSYNWVFGDGSTGTGATVSHTYTADGLYTVTLTVTDGQGNEASTTQAIPITIDPRTGNTPPVATFTAAQESGTAPLTETFDATTSSDMDNDRLSYIWDFGDGTVLTTFDQLISHIFQDPGIYKVLLTVDDGRTTSRATRTITVKDSAAPDGTPVARITASRSTGPPPLSVTFDAKASTASTSEATVKQFNWNFGDGSSLSGDVVSYTFTESGSYTVTLTVTDSLGKTDEETTTIQVISLETAKPLRSLVPIYKLLLLKKQ